MKDLATVLNERRAEYVKYLLELIAINTQDIAHGVGGGLEKPGQEYLMQLLEEMKADEITCNNLKEETMVESLETYGEGNLGHALKERFNVYATFKGKEGGKSLLFNSHIDVMPAEEEGWSVPPFAGTMKDGKIYGRGSADMKGGLMASIMAVKLLQDAGYHLKGDVIITSVCDEEGGGNGSIQAVMDGLKADGVINCEPTNDELVLAHMGWVFFRVEFEGKACHSGTKIDGVSAIDKAFKVIGALTEKEHDWLLRYKHPLLPAPNLNIGVIQGGSAGSTVPGECMFETCVHYIPGAMTHDQVVKEFTDTVNRVAMSDAWLKVHRPKITVYQQGNGFEMDREDPFVKTFQEAYYKSKKKEVNIVGSPAGTDSRLWRNIAKCPVIQFGPGTLEQCHTIDEHITVDSYLESILIYANTILSWNEKEGR